MITDQVYQSPVLTIALLQDIEPDVEKLIKILETRPWLFLPPDNDYQTTGASPDAQRN